MADGTTMRAPRVDPAGRPLEGRARQAALAGGILAAWLAAIVALAPLMAGAPPSLRSATLAVLSALIWLVTEDVGGRRGLVWPASALAIAGSLSLGFAAVSAVPGLRAAPPAETVAIISGGAAVGMAAFLFRFRLPGLVSPVITFSLVALFLAVMGTDGLGRVEGLSARGVLAALIDVPWVAALAGLAGAAGVAFARRLDFGKDDFGLASARPLHVVGAGVAALVAGRAAAVLPAGLDLAALAAIWAAAFLWALRINRVAVLVAIHLGSGKPLVLAVAAPLGLMPGPAGWTALFVGALLADLALWLPLHRMSVARGWTLGPGGRPPRPRAGWLWRYWPYA
jgi:hypothetical protein